MHDDWLWDRSGAPDPEVVALERALAGVDPDPPMPTLVHERPRTSARGGWLAAAALVVLALAGAWWWSRPPAVAPDEWFPTDAAAPTRIAIGSIGFLDLAPGTRLRRIDGTSPHHFELQRGTIHAHVTAQPRVFVVETPSATAVDLGCEYELVVDEHGNSRLWVLSGFVALERDGMECIVPRGAYCETRAGGRLGTAVYLDADPDLRMALSDFDFGGTAFPDRSTALAAVLRRATDRDALTLWHLVPRTTGDDRLAVIERLAELVAPPAGVTRDGALADDRMMMRSWWDEIWRRDDATRSTQPPR